MDTKPAETVRVWDLVDLVTRFDHHEKVPHTFVTMADYTELNEAVRELVADNERLRREIAEDAEYTELLRSQIRLHLETRGHR